MFTGIVEAQGEVTKLAHQDDRTATLRLRGPRTVLEDLAVGGSLAVAGVCLTAIEPVAVRGEEAEFAAVAMGETLVHTNLGGLRCGDRVNLERATPSGARLDGHIVQGHVDGVGTVREVREEGSWRRLRVELPAALAAHIVDKGAVALDGVSLTITAVSSVGEDPAWLEVALIPETLAVTTLGAVREGTRLNVETDMLARHAARRAALGAVDGAAPTAGDEHDGRDERDAHGGQGREELHLTPVPAALERLRAGEPLVVLDDEDRENEGDLILAAEHATPASVGLMVRHTSGYLCAPMTAQRAAELELPLMVPDTEDPLRTAYTISCDARAVEATGISASDRALTARTLTFGSVADLIRPGHVLPLIARDGGVRERPGHTEAAVELTRLAGLTPVGLIGEVVHEDGSLMRAPALQHFARRHGLAIITIEQLTEHLEAGDARPVTQEQA